MTDDQADRILQANAEVKGELVGLQTHVAALVKQVATQNGRVGRLEDWRAEVLVREAHQAGVVEGRTGLRRTQVAILTAVVTIGSSVVGTTAGIIARFV